MKWIGFWIFMCVAVICATFGIDSSDNQGIAYMCLCLVGFCGVIGMSDSK